MSGKVTWHSAASNRCKREKQRWNWPSIGFIFFFFLIGKFRREFVSVLDRCRCSHHDVHSHHSFYLNAQAARLNAISPNTRSMYHYTSQRDPHKSFREKQVSNFFFNYCFLWCGFLFHRNNNQFLFLLSWSEWNWFIKTDD